MLYDISPTQNYRVVFDELAPSWRKELDYNTLFLNGVFRYLEHLLQVRGHLFMNEVLDALDLPRTREGAIVGWVAPATEITREVTERKGGVLVINLRPTGVIFDKLPEYTS